MVYIISYSFSKYTVSVYKVFVSSLLAHNSYTFQELFKPSFGMYIYDYIAIKVLLLVTRVCVTVPLKGYLSLVLPEFS